MPNYLDNIDIYDANGNATNVLFQDRGTLALANANSTHIGDVDTLDTTDKTNTVNAINEIFNHLVDLNDDIYYLYVSDYGALGDGVTDDTTAIQNCINAAIEKSVIVFGNGTYVINGTININTSGLVLMGVGRNSIITRTTQSATPIFNVHKTTRINGFEAKYLSFANISAGSCFIIANTFDSFIHSCYITAISNFIEYGMASETNINIWSRVENIIGDISINNSIFIDVKGYTNGVHVYKCQINSESAHSSTFLRCHPFSNVDTIEMRGNLIQRITYGVDISDDNDARILQNFFMSENIIDSGSENAIIINSNTLGSIICRLMINNNWFNTTSGIPLVFNSNGGHITKVNISNNIFVKARTRAVLMQGLNISSIIINSNTFNGFNDVAAQSPVESCITIGSAISGVIIDNNDFTPSSDVSSNNTYGVYVETGTTACLLNGNNFAGVAYPLTGVVSNAKGNFPTTIDT